MNVADAFDDATFAEGCLRTDPHFFHALSLEIQHLAEPLARLRAANDTDYSQPHCLASPQGGPGGFICAYPQPGMFSRQAMSLKALLPLSGALATTRQALRELATSKGPLAAEGRFYLARIYVSPAARGQGLADQLMEWLLAQARACEGMRSIGLHVRAENATARALYLRHGFTLAAHWQEGYQPMERLL